MYILPTFWQIQQSCAGVQRVRQDAHASNGLICLNSISWRSFMANEMLGGCFQLIRMHQKLETQPTDLDCVLGTWLNWHVRVLILSCTYLDFLGWWIRSSFTMTLRCLVQGSFCQEAVPQDHSKATRICREHILLWSSQFAKCIGFCLVLTHVVINWLMGRGRGLNGICSYTLLVSFGSRSVLMSVSSSSVFRAWPALSERACLRALTWTSSTQHSR